MLPPEPAAGAQLHSGMDAWLKEALEKQRSAFDRSLCDLHRQLLAEFNRELGHLWA